MSILLYLFLPLVVIFFGILIAVKLIEKNKENEFKSETRVKYRPGYEIYKIERKHKSVEKIEETKAKSKKEHKPLTLVDWFEKILPYSLIVIFIIRLFCYQSAIINYVGLENVPLNNSFMKVLGLLLIWLSYMAVVVIIMRKFFDFKTVKNLARFVTGPVFILNLIFCCPIITLLQGTLKFSLLFVVYIIENLIGLLISVYYFIKDIKDKNNYKTILLMFGILLLLMIAAMPNYTLQYLFGNGNIALKVKDITAEHRMFLYVGIVVPVIMYFILRNKSKDIIRFTLIYISIITLVGFLVNFNYTNFFEPWTWPFHLCNTAMFIIPICLIFKKEKLFYFTYFINVLGAVLAMIMPNYANGTNILSLRVWTFWYNHWIAAFMPLLIVALKEFKRPTLKQFIWSMVWFLGYFILVLVLNVVFTALGHSVDYFFINSTFIAGKLGNWAENLFRITAAFNVAGLYLEFHPFYQLVFFFVYVALGLGVWFIYNEFFKIADNHFELSTKLKQIKLDEIARINTISAERREQLMSEVKETKLELKHFSKKYATSKVYAVKDANLEVFGGEIFGFLGPNGAGKSTIIKSIVGIQPITEGSIEICGRDVHTEPVESKAFIGYVPDHYALYEKLSGREYINYIADIFNVSIEERNERIEKYIKLFELEHSIDSKIKTYSHGMKQKITIMAALVHNPKVWILDEPLTGLDPNSIYQVKECMKQHAAEGNIVFFSSHLIDIVEKLCQRIAIIKKGNIKCVKSVEEIEKSGVTLEQFYLNTISSEEVE